MDSLLKLVKEYGEACDRLATIAGNKHVDSSAVYDELVIKNRKFDEIQKIIETATK